MRTPGERIKEARKNADLTQRQLADRIRKSVGMISNLETGASGSPTPETLYLLADALGCNPRWLGIGKGEIYGKEQDGQAVAKKANAELIMQRLEALPDHRRKEMLHVMEKVFEAEGLVSGLLSSDT